MTDRNERRVVAVLTERERDCLLRRGVGPGLASHIDTIKEFNDTLESAEAKLRRARQIGPESPLEPGSCNEYAHG